MQLSSQINVPPKPISLTDNLLHLELFIPRPIPALKAPAKRSAVACCSDPACAHAAAAATLPRAMPSQPSCSSRLLRPNPAQPLKSFPRSSAPSQYPSASSHPPRSSRPNPLSTLKRPAAVPKVQCFTIHNNPFHYNFNYRSISDSYVCMKCSFNQIEYQLRHIHKNLSCPEITYKCRICSRSCTFRPKLPGQCPECL